ncbi:MAG: hypothetical protein M0R46_01510 [Candidatus Muirbacterium halophilum]|nr:hypothetical protein [Candidatus Muirbacterium halophilum]MCK9474572.1 hypothetical protein [Candidatus Muirbacterium halophilum]
MILIFIVKKSHINNFFEFRFSRLDNITNKKDVKLYTSVTNSLSNLTIYQKIDSSLIRNANDDIPINYKISFGKKWDEFYAGLSYQQNFPKNGQDYNLGIQLNYTKEQLMKNSKTLKYFSDIFYSNNNDRYYEIDMNVRYIAPINSRLNLEVSKDYFIVYDDIIGERAYSSEYFLGFNYSLRKSRFYYE